jgi:hypothetical protein
MRKAEEEGGGMGDGGEEEENNRHNTYTPRTGTSNVREGRKKFEE